MMPTILHNMSSNCAASMTGGADERLRLMQAICSLSRQLRCVQEAGLTRDHATLLVSPGTADIFFPTDFQMLDRMYNSTAKAAGKGTGMPSDGYSAPDQSLLAATRLPQDSHIVTLSQQFSSRISQGNASDRHTQCT